MNKEKFINSIDDILKKLEDTEQSIQNCTDVNEKIKYYEIYAKMLKNLSQDLFRLLISETNAHAETMQELQNSIKKNLEQNLKIQMLCEIVN